MTKETKKKDLSDILESWPLDRAGVAARVIMADDGQEFVQLRIDLGVLQMHLHGKPDGHRPHCADSTLDHLTRRAHAEGNLFHFSENDRDELDREIMQFYHRRIALLAVAGTAQRNGQIQRAVTYYRQAVGDADHNLAIMDFITHHAEDPESVDSHEQYRPFVLLHRALACAQQLVIRKHHEAAIEAVKDGEAKIREAYQWRDDPESAEFDPSLLQLRMLGLRLRKQFGIHRTLREQLQEAIDREDFELAAQIRDRMKGDS